MKRVLIVDDAIDLGRMLQDAIKTIAPEASTSLVPSAEEALLESTRLKVDLLVTDLRLPGMSGAELIRKIRVRQPDVRVILMTGMVEDELLEKQKQEARPDLYMHKPISIAAFLEAAQSLLDLPQAQSPADDSSVAAPPSPTLPQARAESEQEAALREVAAMLPVKAKPAPQKRGTGMLSGASEPAHPGEGEGLSGILSRLRGSLGAVAVLLVDERGHSVAQAGDLPDSAQSGQLFAMVMSALSAGVKISYLLGQGAAGAVQAYRGVSIDIVVAPVGPYALLVATRPGRSTTRLALAFEETLEAQSELGAALEEMGVRLSSVVESVVPEAQPAQDAGQEATIPGEILDTPLGQDPDLEKFEELFAKKKTGALNMQDPDDFWSQASPGETGEVTQPGVLSFDQAQKLGLVPEDTDE